MTSNIQSFGFLALDRGNDEAHPALPNGLRDKSVFNFPVIREVVEGARFERVLRGDPELEAAYVAAAKRLQQRGAIAITSNCGWAHRFQSAVAASVGVPVALSSMLFLPTLLRQIPLHSKIAVITGAPMGPDMLQIENPADRARVVVGITGSVSFQNELKFPPPPQDAAALVESALTCAKKLLEEYSEIAAFVLESSSLPPASAAVRRQTGLPVYDTTILAKMTLISAYPEAMTLSPLALSGLMFVRAPNED